MAAGKPGRVTTGGRGHGSQGVCRGALRLVTQSANNSARTAPWLWAASFVAVKSVSGPVAACGAGESVSADWLRPDVLASKSHLDAYTSVDTYRLSRSLTRRGRPSGS